MRGGVWGVGALEAPGSAWAVHRLPIPAVASSPALRPGSPPLPLPPPTTTLPTAPPGRHVLEGCRRQLVDEVGRQARVAHRRRAVGAVRRRGCAGGGGGQPERRASVGPCRLHAGACRAGRTTRQLQKRSRTTALSRQDGEPPSPLLARLAVSSRASCSSTSPSSRSRAACGGSGKGTATGVGNTQGSAGSCGPAASSRFNTCACPSSGRPHLHRLGLLGVPHGTAVRSPAAVEVF